MSKDVFEQLTEGLEEVPSWRPSRKLLRLKVPSFDLVLMPEDSGRFSAIVPAFPEVVAYGATVAEDAHRAIGRLPG